MATEFWLTPVDAQYISIARLPRSGGPGVADLSHLLAHSNSYQWNTTVLYIAIIVIDNFESGFGFFVFSDLWLLQSLFIACTYSYMWA